MTPRQQFDRIFTSYAVCVAATSLGVIVCQCAGLSEVRFFDVFFATAIINLSHNVDDLRIMSK